MTPRVVLFHANGCHLCARARTTLEELRVELGFELEARYREVIPVVEIDGERACTYYVQPEPFRRKLAGAQSRA